MNNTYLKFWADNPSSCRSWHCACDGVWWMQGVAYWQGQLACQRQHRSRSLDNTAGYSLLDTTTHTHTHTHPQIDMCSWTTLAYPHAEAAFQQRQRCSLSPFIGTALPLGFSSETTSCHADGVCVSVCVCVCVRSSLWICRSSAEITAPPCKVSQPLPVKIQRSTARCFESKFVLLMFVCLLHKPPPPPTKLHLFAVEQPICQRV